MYCCTAFAQSDSAGTSYNIDSLNKIYGQHKHFLKEYKAASLIALSYYPELANEQITFRYASINSTGRTTVTFASLFIKENKHYIIYLNDNIKKTGMLPSSVPFDAQVALIAHELAHVLDFQKRGFLEMGWWGLRYLFIKQRTKIEIKADKTVIKRGLGHQLYDLTDFILNHSTANKQYIKMKRSRYLSPEEIQTLTEKYEKENAGISFF
jgi:hypothetical protein